MHAQSCRGTGLAGACLELGVPLDTVGVEPVARVVGSDGRLDVGHLPWLWTQHPQKGRRVHGPGPHLRMGPTGVGVVGGRATHGAQAGAPRRGAVPSQPHAFPPAPGPAKNPKPSYFRVVWKPERAAMAGPKGLQPRDGVLESDGVAGGARLGEPYRALPSAGRSQVCTWESHEAICMTGSQSPRLETRSSWRPGPEQTEHRQAQAPETPAQLLHVPLLPMPTVHCACQCSCANASRAYWIGRLGERIRTCICARAALHGPCRSRHVRTSPGWCRELAQHPAAAITSRPRAPVAAHSPPPLLHTLDTHGQCVSSARVHREPRVKDLEAGPSCLAKGLAFPLQAAVCRAGLRRRRGRRAVGGRLIGLGHSWPPLQVDPALDVARPGELIKHRKLLDLKRVRHLLEVAVQRLCGGAWGTVGLCCSGRASLARSPWLVRWRMQVQAARGACPRE